MTVLALGAAAAAAWISPSAAADKEQTKVSFVSITPVPGTPGWYWHEGYIDSKRKCANNRKVVVYRIEAGPNEKIGSTRANGAVGAWTVTEEAVADGIYYAKAPATSECQADRSNELGIEQRRSGAGG